MEEISYIVVNGERYPVENGTTVNIDGVEYTIEELLALAQEPQATEPSEEPIGEEPISASPASGSYPDVSYVVVNGDKYSIDDEQATTDLTKLQDSVAAQYDATRTYSIGNYCINGGYLYVCVSDIATPEPFTEAHWQRAVVTDIQNSNDYSGLSNKPSINNVTLQGNRTLQELGLQEIYYGTKAEWDAQPTLLSSEGAIYIYSDYSTVTEGAETVNVPAIKIGDGTSYLIDMPIVNGDVRDMILAHINDSVIHVTAQDKTFWNNKSTAFLDPSQQETLIISNNRFMLEGVIYNHG